MLMNFDDQKLKLFVVVTMTNWKEPPRIRHEISHQISKDNNVLFIQLHSQRRVRRSAFKVGSNLIVEKAGISFPGLTRFFWKIKGLRFIYYKYINYLVLRMVRGYGYSSASLINFQYDYPEIMKLDLWDTAVYFCNDDFVNQQPNQLLTVRQKKQEIQAEVVRSAAITIAVSDPLKANLDEYTDRVSVIYSGHGFDLSKTVEFFNKNSIEASSDVIRVCYLGVLNPGIAIDWLECAAEQSNMQLTIIGPAPAAIISRFREFSGFRYFECLSGDALQDELLNHDVLVMPYSSDVENEVTSVPAKLFQYLAVGKPVVSSVMPNLIELPDGFVYMAQDKYEFLNLIKKSFQENCERLVFNRINVAKDNTWDARGKQLKALMHSVA